MLIKPFLAAVVSCCVLVSGALAHELQANRLTLVVRDDTHVSVTYFLNYTEALHRALASRLTPREFMLRYAALSPSDFQAELTRAQATFSGGFKLTQARNEVLTVSNWRWPDATRVQAQLQERVMQALVGGGEHAEHTPFEVRAEATATRAITSLTIRTPLEFSKVLVVSYKPKQAWVTPGTGALQIQF